MKKVVAIIALAAVVASGAVPAAGDAAAGKNKAAACAGCHGADGTSVNPEWPSLAGQHEAYLLKQLQDFKSGDKRNNALMAGQVAALSAEDMADLAAYFAGLPGREGTADPAKVEAGQSLYRGGNATSGVSACIACHSPAGAGNPQAMFPQLGGQHAAYTVLQLKSFRSGERANDAGQMMRNIAAKMTDDEMNSVAQYIQGLH